jgi:hypothetical protein
MITGRENAVYYYEIAPCNSSLLQTAKYFFMKPFLLYSLFIVFFMNACAQSPGVKVHAYSRVTIPGIRPESDKDNNIFPVNYFIYLEVKKGTTVVAEGYWINGKYYATPGTEKVKSPVIVTEQTVIKQQHDTLVKKTGNEVYMIGAAEEKSRTTNSDKEKKAIQENQLVLLVKINGKQQVISVKNIKELTPAAMM